MTRTTRSITRDRPRNGGILHVDRFNDRRSWAILDGRRLADPIAVTRSELPRLWKCRSRGNHKTISTGPWKSRTKREISTFPQADCILVRQQEPKPNPQLKTMLLEASLDTGPSVRTR